MTKLSEMSLADRWGATVAAIRRHGPEHFDMDLWFHAGGYSPYLADEMPSFGRLIEQCGTTACIAGHAVATLVPRKLKAAFRDETVGTLAEELLGLTTEEKAPWREYGPLAETFFHTSHWPTALQLIASELVPPGLRSGDVGVTDELDRSFMRERIAGWAVAVIWLEEVASTLARRPDVDGRRVIEGFADGDYAPPRRMVREIRRLYKQAAERMDLAS